MSAADGKSLDITQRIERKLAEYNASQNAFKRWLFEILSWSLSLVCLAAVVGIYVHLKDRPIADPMSGMLLTLANVLGKVASAALIVPTTEALGQLKWNWFYNSKAMWDFEIFDKASRGPLGAVMLLFRTKGRSLAALGALLVVLLLAIDTFLQQVIDLPDRWALQSVVGTLPVTVRYNSGTEDVYRNGSTTALSDPDIFRIVEKFSYGNGTQPVPFGNGTRPDIPLSCPTSRCTWPAYETLGVCTQCAEISHHLQYACLAGTVDWTSDLLGGWSAPKTYPNGTMCGYFLNSTSEHPVLMSGYLTDSYGISMGEALVMRTLPLTTLLTKEPLYGNGSINFKQIRNPIVNVLIVSAANGSAETVYQAIRPVAQECVLSWCVKTIHSSYDYGVYIEKVTEEYVNTTEGAFPWSGEPYMDIIGGGTDLSYLQNIELSGTTSDGHYFDGYGTDNDTALAVVMAINDIFPAFTSVNKGSNNPVMRYRLYTNGHAHNRYLKFNPWVAPNNVSRHMERLAEAMTNVIRSAPSKIMVEGHAFSKETYVAVHWEWLTFPFLLLLLSLVFLVSTIIKTSGAGDIGVWKTSAMPALIYSLPKETQGQFTSSSTWSSDREAPKKTRIRLLPNTGWRVSGQSYLSRSPRLPSGERVPRGWI